MQNIQRRKFSTSFTKVTLNFLSLYLYYRRTDGPTDWPKIKHKGSRVKPQERRYQARVAWPVVGLKFLAFFVRPGVASSPENVPSYPSPTPLKSAGRHREQCCSAWTKALGRLPQQTSYNVKEIKRFGSVWTKYLLNIRTNLLTSKPRWAIAWNSSFRGLMTLNSRNKGQAAGTINISKKREFL